MISVELAAELRDAGVRWDPEPGDRFVIPGRQMDDEIFVVSTMVIDVAEAPAGPIIRFNGTVEWAIDSILQSETLWIPTESQLRNLLGGAFRDLSRLNGRYEVGLRVMDRDVRISGDDAEDAYANALLFLATGRAESG